MHNENDVALMQDAKRGGIKIMGMWRSWDNPTQQMLRVFPDILICGSEELKKESIILHNYTDPYILEILETLGYQVLVRYPPGEDIKSLDVRKWPEGIVFDKPGYRFSGWPDFEIMKKDDENLIDQIHYSSLVITGPTSIPLDAALMDKPVIIADIYPTQGNKYDKGWGFLLNHIAKLLNTKGTWHAETREQFIEAVQSYLKDPT